MERRQSQGRAIEAEHGAETGAAAPAGRAVQRAVSALHDSRHGSEPIGAVEAVEQGELGLGECLWLHRDQRGQRHGHGEDLVRVMRG